MKKLMAAVLVIALLLLSVGCTSESFYPVDGKESPATRTLQLKGYCVLAVELINREGGQHSILYLDSWGDRRQVEVVNVFSYFGPYSRSFDFTFEDTEVPNVYRLVELH